jgi:glycosyltransferase involved in cell wall biosynthesis
VTGGGAGWRDEHEHERRDEGGGGLGGHDIGIGRSREAGSGGPSRLDGCPMQDRPARVLTLIDTVSNAGGAERIAATLTAHLDPEKFERTLCATRAAKNPAADRVRAAGARVMSLDRRTRFGLWEWRPLVSLLRRERIDVVHTHGFGSNAWGVVAARLARVPVVIAHEHTWSFEGQPFRQLIDRHVIARAADAVLAVSREDRRRMIEIEGIDPHVVRFVANGIEPLATGEGDVRKELGISPAAPVVGTVSVLRPQKALHILVTAAVALSREFPELRVLIAGTGPERPKLEGLIRNLGVQDHVLLLGMRHDVPDLLSAMDVAVCCSDFEGSPLSVMEYMAAGKPVVATRVGGLPDLIEHGVHGLLVERRKPDALAAALRQLLRDPGRAAAMGARGRRRQEREYTLDAMTRRIESLYELYLRSASSKKRRSRSS